MTDHLPECFANDVLKHGPCICDRLRACEQRLLREAASELPRLRHGKGCACTPCKKEWPS